MNCHKCNESILKHNFNGYLREPNEDNYNQCKETPETIAAHAVAAARREALKPLFDLAQDFMRTKGVEDDAYTFRKAGKEIVEKITSVLHPASDPRASEQVAGDADDCNHLSVSVSANAIKFRHGGDHPLSAEGTAYTWCTKCGAILSLDNEAARQAMLEKHEEDEFNLRDVAILGGDPSL